MKIIELFAGLGSQTQALINLGIEHEVAAISEIDKYALISYEALHGKPNNLGDITKIAELPQADLWTYSFPCQDISLAGKQAGIKEGTRSGLLFEVERLLRVSAQNNTLPKYLLLENVKPLVGTKFKPDFDKWVAFLSSLGYKSYWQILNTRNYCIPQNRERVFCVSIRGEHEPFRFPEKRELRLRLKDMLDATVEEKYYLTERALTSLLNATYNTERGRIQNLDGVHRTMCARDHKSPTCIQAGTLTGEKWDKMHDISRRVYNPDGISPTLHCAGGGNTEPKIVQPSCIKEGELFGGAWDKRFKMSRSVYSPDGVSPTLHCCGGGGTEPKIIVEGNYSPSSHNAARVVNADGLAPTVMENHGTVTAVKIIDDTYKSREPRVYSEVAPSIRSEQHNFKVVSGQFQPVNRDYKEDGELRAEHFECRKDEVANAVLTGDRKNCVKIVAMRGRQDEPGGKWIQRLEPSKEGVTNTLTSVQKDNLLIEPQVLKKQRTEYGKASRKAYEAHEIPGDRKAMREQVPRTDGVSNTLTTVQKDNILIEPPNADGTFVGRAYNKFINKKGYVPEMFNAYNRAEIKSEAPTLTTQCGSPTASGSILKAETDEVSKCIRVGGHGLHERHTWDVIAIKEATKKGYAEANPGDFVNTQFPGSTTKRGRVGKGVCHTLQCGDSSAVVTENVRIRKLTPWECLRLQGWRDTEIAKIRAAGISNAQAYRQAGNGITVTVLMAIFGELFGVEYKEILDEWRY